MKIASWNVNSLRVRLPQVLDWAQREQPDILALQETKLQDVDFPQQAIREAGFEIAYCGQKTYNGVAVLSRLPTLDAITDINGLEDPQRRILEVSCGEVRLLNLYVPNGQEVGTQKYAYKLDWLEKVTAHVRGLLAGHSRVVVVGDFNIAPDDRDVHDPAQWAGKILCSEPERDAFRALLQAGLSDSFRLFEQSEQEFSWWDYRAAGFRRNRGLRIDHILVSEQMRARCLRSWVDKAPRKLERPSDHAPVVAEFEA